MAENTKIEWADDTFNPWIGCTKVAPECKNCYAETRMDKRLKKVKWGPNGTRTVTSPAYWNNLTGWNYKAMMAGVKRRVFCASLADVFEDWQGELQGDLRDWRTMNDVRAGLWERIEENQNLIFLLLTKRPENIRAMVPARWLTAWPANVWTGTSAGCQETADNAIPHLLRVPGPHFLSCEPMLGPVDLTKPCDDELGVPSDALEMGIQWVIVGGESGPGARPMHPDWARGLRDQCVSAGVAFFFKQWGEWCPVPPKERYEAVFCIPRKGKPKCEVINKEGKYGSRTSDEAVWRVGKAKAGRMLDGRTWDELPKAFGGVEVSA